MAIRYSWLWNGATILFFAGFALGTIFALANNTFLEAAFFALCALLAAYVIAMSPQSGQLDETRMTMRMLWGATYQMNWDEVVTVKTNSAQFVFVGKDKWFSVTLLAALDRKQVAEYLRKEITGRRFAESPLKFSDTASFWLFRNARTRN